MTEVNTGHQNKSNGGRSILDYSLVACFTLIVLLGILVLDAFEYISVPGASKARGAISSLSIGGMTQDEANAITASMTAEQLEEAQKQIDAAKALLEEKTEEVEKIVTKVEEELKEEKVVEAVAAGLPVPAAPTPEVQKVEEEIKVEIVKAVVEKELDIDTFCSGCQYGSMAFTCARRVDWLMTSYGLTEDMAKESACNKCCLKRGNRKTRGLLRMGNVFSLNEEEEEDIESMARGMYENWEQ